MDRPEDGAPGRDASTLELRNDLIDRTLDLDHEAMVHVTATGVGRQSAGQARQPDRSRKSIPGGTLLSIWYPSAAKC